MKDIYLFILNKKKIFSILLYFLIFSGCEKEHHSYNYLTDYAKTYGAFNIGSYWIYQQDSSLLIDSIYVIDLKHTNWARPIDSDGDIEHYESLTCNLSSLINSLSAYRIKVDSEVGYIDYNLYNWDANAAWQYAEENLVKIPHQDWSTVMYHDSININGNLYLKVYEIENHFYTPYDYKRLNAFVVSGVGLLKWSMLKNDSTIESWSLLRSRVVF